MHRSCPQSALKFGPLRVWPSRSGRRPNSPVKKSGGKEDKSGLENCSSFHAKRLGSGRLFQRDLQDCRTRIASAQDTLRGEKISASIVITVVLSNLFDRKSGYEALQRQLLRLIEPVASDYVSEGSEVETFDPRDEDNGSVMC